MFLAAAAPACTVTGPTSTRVAAAALQNVFEALPWLNILTLSCEAFPTESRAVGAASLRGVELVSKMVRTPTSHGFLAHLRTFANFC